MIKAFVVICVLAVGPADRALAVQNVSTSGYNETAPTSCNIANWASGWTQPAIEPTGYAYTTGWNYLGTINNASGTYLGYGWVLTAAHVGAGSYTLGGTTYNVVPNSAQEIGTTDLVVFQVSPVPSLPPLPFSTSDPVAYFTQVAMLGFGDGGPRTSESWGCNTVTDINQSVTPDGYPYVSNDFLTATGTSSGDGGSPMVTNNYQLIIGDSGGGDFVYNPTHQQWELAGINEVVGTITYDDGTSQNVSGFVQLDTYAQQIEQIIVPPATDTPTMPAWALGVLAGLLLAAAWRQSCLLVGENLR